MFSQKNVDDGKLKKLRNHENMYIEKTWKKKPKNWQKLNIEKHRPQWSSLNNCISSDVNECPKTNGTASLWEKKTIVQVYSTDFLPNNNNWLISKISWFN